MKKIIAGVFAVLVSLSVFGATTVPVQLLNPTGSSSGQAIVSTGASNAPAWGGIGVNGIAAIAANTVIANATGSSAGPTAFAMPSCSTSSSILQYTSGTGFTCNTGVWAAPPAIGGATPASGKFTTLQATGSITPSTTAGIVGTTAGDNANAGSVGEFVSSTLSSGSAITLTNSTAANITSITLTAGDWNVWGTVSWTTSAGSTSVNGWISTTSATLPNQPNNGAMYVLNSSSAVPTSGSFPTGMTRLSLTSTTTVYLGVDIAFSSGTALAYGFIGARRIR